MNNNNEKAVTNKRNWKDNYQAIIDKNLSDKYSYLEKSLFLDSERLLYEIANPNRNFWSYKRGTIVRVDFGVNLDCEFSQQHFAIVISKRDRRSKNLIVVVPLTSKYHEGNTIPLGNLIVKKCIKKYK